MLHIRHLSVTSVRCSLEKQNTWRSPFVVSTWGYRGRVKASKWSAPFSPGCFLRVLTSFQPTLFNQTAEPSLHLSISFRRAQAMLVRLFIGSTDTGRQYTTHVYRYLWHVIFVFRTWQSNAPPVLPTRNPPSFLFTVWFFPEAPREEYVSSLHNSSYHGCIQVSSLKLPHSFLRNGETIASVEPTVRRAISNPGTMFDMHLRLR